MVRLVIISFALLLCSCGSRRKTVESLEVRSSYERTADSAFSFLEQIRAENIRLYNASVDEKNRVIEYEGGTEDSLNISEYGPGGELISETIITGKGKAKITEGTKHEQVKTSEQQQLNEQRSSAGSGSVKDTGEAFQESLDKHIATSGSIFQYWWILLFVLGALWYLNKRYGWWAKIKSHVTASKHQ